MKNKKLLTTLAIFGFSFMTSTIFGAVIEKQPITRVPFQEKAFVARGDTFTLLMIRATKNYQILPKTFDSCFLKALYFEFEKGVGIDSIFVYDSDLLIGKAVGVLHYYQQSSGPSKQAVIFSIDINRWMLVGDQFKNASTYRIVCKASSQMGAKILFSDNGFASNSYVQKGIIANIVDVYKWNLYTTVANINPDAFIKLSYKKNNNQKLFCSKDSISVLLNYVGKKYIIKEYLFLNDKFVTKEFLQNISLSAGQNKILVRTIDSFYRESKDSLLLYSYLNPEVKIVHSSNFICKGGSANISFSGINITNWYWDVNGKNILSKTLSLTDSSNIILYTSSLEGCETMVTSSLIPKNIPEKPLIQKDDSVLWSLNNKFNDSLVWRNMDDPILGANKRFFKPLHSGYYTLRVYNEYGCMNESDLLIYSLKQKPSSISNFGKTVFSVYPNPAIDQFTIESNFEKGEAQLVDMQGRVVRKTVIENGSNTFQRDGVVAGVYYIHYKGDVIKIVFQ